MIISKTPLRLSFVGGGSDLPSYYREAGGAVLSTSIDKFVYITINKRFNEGIRLSYSKTEEVSTVAEVEHKIVRATLDKLGINGGVEITSVSAGGPAANAGLKAGDVVTKLQGVPLEQSGELIALVRKFAPGASVRVDYQRDGAARTAQVTLTSDSK